MAEVNDNSGSQEKSDVEIKFTPEQQTKVDDIVSKRVNEIKAQQQKVLDDTLAKAKAEWEEQAKIAALTGQEKVQAEYTAKLSKAQREQETMSAELKKVQNELAISKAQAQLASLNLPPQFADKMLGKDDDETTKNIQAFDAMIKELVAQKVNENVARGTPKIGGDVKPSSEMQAQIAKVMGVKV